MNARDFENSVWNVDKIRLVVCCSNNVELVDYGYANAANKNSTLSEWLENRIYPNIDGHQVIVIGGNGKQPHGNSLVQTVRDSYATD